MGNPQVQFRVARSLYAEGEACATAANMELYEWARAVFEGAVDAALGRGFFVEDQPVEEVRAAFENGVKGVTGPPPPGRPAPITRKGRPNPRECIHPPGRRIGNSCGLCGTDLARRR